jgi:3-oxoacid CoA-transferase subunit B
MSDSSRLDGEPKFMAAGKERLDREVVAMRVAKELPDGGYVNLGIGIPTLVSSFVPEGSVVFYHSESGVLNCGPLADEGEEDIDLINAGGQFLQPVPGMAFFSSVEGFAMIRGGHVDVTVLGAHQVSAKGDLANWMLPERGVGNIGGAMDLAAGARQVIVAMEHTDRQNQPKIVEECTYPITGKECVSLIVTDIAVIEPTLEGLVLREVAPGWTPEDVQELTQARLIIPPDWKEYEL